MSDLIQRFRQRKLVQWSVAYLATAWVALEAVSILSEMWGWPSVVGRVAFVILGVGLVTAIVLAWFHGERGHQRVTALEATLLGTIVVAGGFVTVLVARAPDDAIPGPVAARAAPIGPPPDERSLVVLPFVDLSPGGGHEYLADGITETLISGLGRVEELRVVARTSAFQFKGQAMDVREIGRRLGVASVLDGTVTQIGNRVRITASLYDATSGLDRWSQRFDRETEAEDLFVVQDEVAQAILAALEIELGSLGKIVSDGTRNPAAQRAYFLGMHHWTARTTADVERATDYFHEAIALDSMYADAWAGLALSYVLHIPSEYGVAGLTPTQALDRAELSALRAIELDPTLAAPHAALGLSYQSRARPEDAEEQFRLGIEKNPGYATAHHWLADHLMVLLRGEEALAEMEIAESLDPVAPAILAEKGQALMMLGRHEEALAHMDRSLELLPRAHHVFLFSAWFGWALDDWERAASHFAGALRLEGESPETIQRVESSLRDPTRRAAFLRDVADGTAGQFVSSSAGALSSAQSRFNAMLKVDGPEVALRFLASVIRGPDRVELYPPIIPAMMGPDLSATPAAREVMRLLVETSLTESPALPFTGGGD